MFRLYFPYTTLFRSAQQVNKSVLRDRNGLQPVGQPEGKAGGLAVAAATAAAEVAAAPAAAVM